MEVKLLEDLASFNVAKYVWSCFLDDKKLSEKIRYRNLQIDEQKLFDLDETFLKKLYPCLPSTIQRRILNATELIGTYTR